MSGSTVGDLRIRDSFLYGHLFKYITVDKSTIL